MLSSLFIKFLVIFVLSFLFGLERQITKKSVGFGTFIFVSVGSCALGVITIDFSPENSLPLLGQL